MDIDFGDVVESKPREITLKQYLMQKGTQANVGWLSHKMAMEQTNIDTSFEQMYKLLRNMYIEIVRDITNANTYICKTVKLFNFYIDVDGVDYFLKEIQETAEVLGKAGIIKLKESA